jgi:hypothetical protein
VTGDGGGPAPSSSAEQRSVRLINDAIAAVRAHLDDSEGNDPELSG